MKSLHLHADRAAIGLSLLCALHCLALPLVVVFLPTVVAARVEGEVFHGLMVIAVVPISAYALTMGCNRHRHYATALAGASGLIMLCMAARLGHEALGEMGEKALTLLGVSLLALGHLWNYRLCRVWERCECAEKAEEC